MSGFLAFFGIHLHSWVATDDRFILGDDGKVYSVILYSCTDCGQPKIKLKHGSVQIEDLT